MLLLEGIGKTYGERAVLRDISLRVPPASVLFIAGPNGSGKSTLLRIMAGLVRPDAGRVVRQAGPGRTGYLGHDTLIYPALTALENLHFWTRLHGRANDHTTLMDALDRMHLAPFANEAAGVFSRGMLQRLSLARLFLLAPAVALVDEPLTGLDEPSAALVRRELTALARSGATVVWVTHDPDRDAAHADARADTLVCLDATGQHHGPEPLPGAPSEKSAAPATPHAATPASAPAPGLFAAACSIAAKDLRLMTGRGGSFAQVLLLGVLLTVLFSLGVGGSGDAPSPQAAAAVFWLCSAFCLTILASALFSLEEPGKPRLGLLLSPVPPQAVWLGKWAAAMTLLVAIQAVFLLSGVVFMGQAWQGDIPLALVGIFLVDTGGVALAALAAALARGQAARESLASLVVFPLLTPLLLAGIRILAALYAPSVPGPAQDAAWVAFAAASDAVIVGAALVLFPLLYGGDG